jgi:hypothetical protein
VTRPVWRPPRLLFDSFTSRAPYLDECRKIDPGARYLRPRKGSKNSFGIAVAMNPAGVPTRHITIYFPKYAPGFPRVYVDGPDDSPHRYLPDRHLCMWHPGDPPEARWKPADGPGALLGHVAAHLVKEEWYRRTEQWPGAEAEHIPRTTEGKTTS